MHYAVENEVILVEDDWEQQIAKSTTAPIVCPGPSQRRRASKRSRNGKVISSQEPTEAVHAGSVLTFGHPASNGSMPITDSIIVDGQDVFIIQELEEDSSQQMPVFELQTDGEIANFQPSDEETISMKDVDPLELSDIWNDLITANQEILILLELQDLKHHIVDARCIEDQMKNMVCEYCPQVFSNNRIWNQHIKKVHFQTELFECDCCDGKFEYFSRFKDHLNGHTGQRPYQCDECNHQYAFRIGFLVHKILEHMKLHGVYVCPKCNLDCKNAQHYKLHIAKHIDFTPHNNPGTAVPLDGSRTSFKRNSQTKEPVLHAQNSEQNKFLNVYESFSKELKKVAPVVEKVRKRKA
ncbi:myoneurin [Wyeomyia smithii]|uniref:myoneurin n=1 Tax=Wyeomyia smithii TaxID=174621 RepID=UPI002467DB9A|nr:myoneurin [Wyeomyia smithii]XP_055532363.1 myoneurin [Wyeomyia smithii]